MLKMCAALLLVGCSSLNCDEVKARAEEFAGAWTHTSEKGAFAVSCLCDGSRFSNTNTATCTVIMPGRPALSLVCNANGCAYPQQP